MAQQPADNLKAEAVRNKMRRIGVAIVVAAVVGDVRFPDRCRPELLNVCQVLAGDIASEEVQAFRVPLDNAGNQARSGGA